LSIISNRQERGEFLNSHKEKLAEGKSNMEKLYIPARK
jgi:hypothetical protein